MVGGGRFSRYLDISLQKAFDHLMGVIGATKDGKKLVEKARSKFKNRLYAIYKDANAASSTFSVLCHGFPVQDNFMFAYKREAVEGQQQSFGRPVEAKLINFHVS